MFHWTHTQTTEKHFPSQQSQHKIRDIRNDQNTQDLAATRSVHQMPKRVFIYNFFKAMLNIQQPELVMASIRAIWYDVYWSDASSIRDALQCFAKYALFYPSTTHQMLLLHVIISRSSVWAYFLVQFISFELNLNPKHLF